MTGKYSREWVIPGAPSVQDPVEGECFFQRETEIDEGKNSVACVE